MKINLPEETVQNILQSLESTNRAEYNYNGLILRFRMENLLFNNGSVMDFVTALAEHDRIMSEFAKNEARVNGYTFATIARNRHPEQLLQSGKLVYVYFFAQHKYDTVPPEELYELSDVHSWVAYEK